jgi:signal transduction histidine kinase
MKPSIGKKITLGFLVALAALLAIGYLSSNELQGLQSHSSWVDHTYQVQQKMEALAGDLARAESSARGYALLPDAALEADATQAAAEARRDLNEVRTLTQDNPSQQDRLDRLEPLISKRLDSLQRLMELAPGDATNAARVAAIREGEADVVQVRQMIRDMQEEENTLLANRKAAVTRVTGWTYAILVYGTLLAFGLVGLVGVIITWSITRPISVLSIGAGKIGSGDYSHRVIVKSRDEVGRLARHFNRMAEQVQERQLVLAEQDWLKTGLTRIGHLFQGQRDRTLVCQTVLAELASLLNARHSALYVADSDGEKIVLNLQGAYASDDVPEQIVPGQGLVGQCYLDGKRIQLGEIPPDYLRIKSALGEAAPRTILVQPTFFEGKVLAVLELALLHDPTPMQLTLLERVADSLGIVLNTIGATQRTEELLAQSQNLSAELRLQQEELNRKNRELEGQATRLRNSELLLQEQQEELKQTNEELEQTNEELQQTNEEIEEKANLLAAQKREAEKTNLEIEQARRALQEKAEQIAQTSKYKSEFLANMSHELRTPLNSLLILSKILAENHDDNLTEKQVQYANTIYSSGNDLLELINEVLDLSKIESGAVELEPDEVPFTELSRFVEQTFRPVAENKKIDFQTSFDPQLPPSIQTDTRRIGAHPRRPGHGRMAARKRDSQPRAGGGCLRDYGYRHRHSARETGTHFPGLPAGRRGDFAQVWRHGTRPFDQPANRRAAGRNAAGREQAGRREHVHPFSVDRFRGRACARAGAEGNLFPSAGPVWPSKDRRKAGARSGEHSGRPGEAAAGRLGSSDHRGRSGLRGHPVRLRAGKGIQGRGRAQRGARGGPGG